MERSFRGSDPRRRKQLVADYSDQHFLNEKLDASHLGHMTFAVVTAKWNDEVTSKLKEGAISKLKESGISSDQIKVYDVPGTFELIYGSSKMLNDGCDAVIALGCVIQGETRHFDFICDAVANGIAQLNIEHNKPVAFGVLTTDNMEQALERSGGKHGHKGEEAASSILQLLI